MKRVIVILAAFAVSACDPNIPTSPKPTAVVTARMDLTVTPPIAPAPNDLATDPATGLLAIPLAANASDADVEFAGYLDTLDGFPAGAAATTTFDGKLSAASVTNGTVKVVDITDNYSDVVGVTISYHDTLDTTAPGLIEIDPPATGWAPGHTIAIAIAGGDSGVTGGNNGVTGGGGEKVVASANWALLRSLNKLEICTATQGCQASTALIPSTQTDPVQRAADTEAKAHQLEQLRQKYQPLLDHLDTLGIKRSDVAIAWSFKISDDVKMGFYPTNVPPIVPTPNDLAINPATGLVNAPVDPNSPAANQEFTTDYLNTLDGFPSAASAAAVVLLGDLDPTTVTAGPANVLVIDAVTGETLTAAVAYVAATGTTPGSITISPPLEGWGKSKHIAIAIGPGVHRSNGAPVLATEVWALARSASSLVTCTDITPAVCGASPIVPPDDCAPALTLSPLSPGQAVQLECLRLGYAPLLDALENAGLARADNALTWVFSTVDSPEAVFDPAGLTIPFPNDLLFDQANNKVNIPVPMGAPPTVQQLIGGLNTLDGFSTTAPIVSENSDQLGAIDVGSLDPSTLDGGVLFMPLQLAASGLPPEFQVCLNCRSSTDSSGNRNIVLADGGFAPAPDQLQIVPLAPLDEDQRYAVVMTSDLVNTDGKHVISSLTHALLRSKNPLLVNGHSAVSGVTDGQASQLEPIRAGLAPLYDLLEASGYPRKKLVLAWTFKTQSEVSVLKQLQLGVGVLGGAGALPTAPGFIAGGGAGTQPYDGASAAVGSLWHQAVDALFVGTLTMPFALTGTAGTFNSNPAMWSTQKVPFMMSVPTRNACATVGAACTYSLTGAAGTCASDNKCTPNAGFPVLLFGHGLTRGHTDMIAMAWGAGKGYVTVATDVVFHGDRSICTGVGTYLSFTTGMSLTDDAACADPVNMMCDEPTGRCIKRTGNGSACPGGDIQCLALGEGSCRATGFCEAGDFKRDSTTVPVISGWNYLNLNNLFVTRDNFRNTVLDNAQWVRILNDATATGLNGKLQGLNANWKFDPTTMDYIGQSLGTFNGAMTAAVNGNLRHVGLNVAGSDQTLVLLTAPSFGSVRTAFLGQLQGLGLVPGTPGFDNFIVLAKTILDPADSNNAIHFAVNNASATGRATFIQYIEGDTVLPNPTTEELIAAASRGAALPIIKEYHPDPSYPAANRHGFMLDPSHDPNCPFPAIMNASFDEFCLTLDAQVHMNNFVKTGTP